MKPIERRQFLKGSVLVLGATAVGVLPNLAEGSSTSPLAVPNLYRWTGEMFSPTSGRADSAPLPQVQVTVRSYGPPDRLEAIDLVSALPGGSTAVFHAWTAPPHGANHVQFTVESAAEALLRLVLVDGVSDLRLPLQLGTYVLTFGSLAGCRLGESGTELVDRRGPRGGSYQIISVMAG